MRIFQIVVLAAACAVAGDNYRVPGAAPDAPPWWIEPNPPEWWVPESPLAPRPTPSFPVPPPFGMNMIQRGDEEQDLFHRLRDRYRMPIIVPDIDFDRAMVIVPDPNVRYPMPIIVPEGWGPPAPKPRVRVFRDRSEPPAAEPEE